MQDGRGRKISQTEVLGFTRHLPKFYYTLFYQHPLRIQLVVCKTLGIPLFCHLRISIVTTLFTRKRHVLFQEGNTEGISTVSTESCRRESRTTWKASRRVLQGEQCRLRPARCLSLRLGQHCEHKQQSPAETLVSISFFLKEIFLSSPF